MSFMKPIRTTDVNEAMEFGNHNFEVEKHRLHTETGLVIPDQVAIVNRNTGSYLGTVGHGWEPVQPDTLYELAGELIHSTGCSINGVFSLRGGRIIGISFNIAEREYIAGDPISLNFIMLNAFDGSHGLAGHAPTSRAACLNVCNTSNKVYNLRHTKNVLNRVLVVKNMLKYYQNEIQSFDEKMQYLVSHNMNQDEAVAWFRSLFPKPTTDRAETRLDNQVATFVNCLLHGRGSDIVGVRGTSYGAFQALTEFINHERTVRVHGERDEEEVRFETIHFGSGNSLTQKGLSKLTSSFLLDASEFMIT